MKPKLTCYKQRLMFKIVLLSFSLVFLSLSFNSLAQSVPSHQFSSYLDENNWYQFKVYGATIKADSFFEKNSDSLGLDTASVYKINGKPDTIPTLNLVIWRYDHYYKDVLVISNSLVLKSDLTTGNAINLHGKITRDISLDTTVLTADSALIKIGLDSIDADNYAWEDSSWTAQLVQDELDSNASWYPVVTKWIKIDSNGNAYLVIRYPVLVIDTSTFYHYLVTYDVANSQIESIEDIIDRCTPTTGTAITKYNGLQSINIDDCSGTTRLHDDPRNIHVKNVNTIFIGKRSWDAHDDYGNSSTDYGTNHQSGTSVLWALAAARDFFSRAEFETTRSKVVNARPVRAFADLETNIAWFKPNGKGLYKRPTTSIDMVGFGTFQGKTVGTLDVCAHELGHAFHTRMTGVDAGGIDLEMGAIKESYGDILGVATEYYTTGVLDWDIEEDLYTNGSSLRNLATGIGNAGQQARIYGGTVWNGDTDGHIRCGVQSKWFQLLVDGGDFNGVHVHSIGFDKAILIAIQTMYTLSNLPDYAEVRAASLDFTKLKYGECSHEYVQVLKAWRAVNVGPAFSTTYTQNPLTSDVLWINSGNSPYIINTDESFNGSIVVQNGGELQITNCTVEFSDRDADGGYFNIFVNSGGKLIIDNATLTGYEIQPTTSSPTCSTPWGGILLQGSGIHSIQLAANHGELEMKNGSVIQYARKGIQVGNSSSNSGGRLFVENSEFKNCKNSINFYHYPFYSNVSRVRRTDFVCDTEIPGYAGESISSFVNLYGVKGVAFFGCTFKNLVDQNTIAQSINSLGQTVREKGVGITGWDAGFYVGLDYTATTGAPCNHGIGGQSLFRGLDVGVSVQGSSSSTTSTVTNSDFENNIIAMKNAGQWNTTFWSNDIVWDNSGTPLLENGHVWGLFNEEAYGFNFSDNTVHCDEVDDFTYDGVYVNGSKDLNDPNLESLIGGNLLEMNMNLLSSLHYLPSTAASYVGVRLDGDNTSLYINCNEFRNWGKDVELYTGTLAPQEVSSGQGEDPNNLFSTPCGGVAQTYLQLDNKSSSTLTYYWVSGSSITCQSGTYQPLNGQPNTTCNGFGSYYTTEDILGCTGQQEGGDGTETTPPTNEGGDYTKAFYAVEGEDYTLLATLKPALSQTEGKIINILESNKIAGNNFYHLNKESLQELGEILETAPTGEQHKIVGLLEHFAGEKILHDQIPQGATPNMETLGLIPIENDKSVKVKPNPSTGIFELELVNDKFKTIELIDLRGRQLQKIVSEEGESSIQLSLQGNPPGIYYIRISTTKGELKMNKLILQ